MKKITYIEPVSNAQGSLTPKKKLEYALHDNPAFYAPRGQKEKARNYQTIYVGHKRNASGRNYFSVRGKASVTLTRARLRQMAIIGGAGAIYSAIVANTATPLYQGILAAYNAEPVADRPTFKKYVMRVLQTMLRNYMPMNYFWNRSTGAYTYVQSPWNYQGQANVQISSDIIVKFFEQLYDGTFVKFTVDGKSGVCPTGIMWETYCSEDYNNLGLTCNGENARIFSGSLVIATPEGGMVIGRNTVQALAYKLVSQI